MSLPRILLVDDSDAILAYETAALGRDYAVTQASDGLAALAEMRANAPDLVLLDLSMPRCNGEEVLSAMGDDPALSEVPVIVVTSETARGRECLSKGARAFLPKPTQAAELRRVVAEVLRDVARAREAEDLQVLVFRVSQHTLAIALSVVGEVVLEPATSLTLVGADPMPVFDLHGERVAVVDVAAGMGVERSSAPIDRWDIVLHGKHRVFALSVDAVVGPEVYPRAAVTMAAGHELGLPILGRIKAGDLTIPLLAWEAILPRASIPPPSSRHHPAAAVS